MLIGYYFENFSFVYLVTAVYDAAVVREDALEARKILLKYDCVYDKLVEDDMMKDYILAFKHILFSMSAYLSRCAKKDDLYHEVALFITRPSDEYLRKCLRV